MRMIYVVQSFDSAKSRIVGASEERKIWDGHHPLHMGPDEIQKPFDWLSIASSFRIYPHHVRDEWPTRKRNITNAATELVYTEL